jgi:hypothetical protein
MTGAIPEQETAAQAISRLLRSMPPPTAPAWRRVEWLFEKAAVLRLIARVTPDQADEARELADAADRRAFDIAQEAT